MEEVETAPKEHDRTDSLIIHDELTPAIPSNINLIVAFCLDGTVYAIDGDGGGILWKTVGSFTDGPLLKKHRKRAEAEVEVEYIVEPLGDGAIFQAQAGGIKRLPFTLKSLVHLSPVHWKESEERALYLIAKRESSIFVLDLMSGRVRRRQFKESEEEAPNEDGEIAPLEKATLLVGRTDYHVQGFDEGTLEADWEIVLTQFKTLHPAATSFSESDLFYTTFNGHLVSKQRWVAKLGSPVLQIFKPVTTTRGFITLQEIELKGSSVSGDSHVLFDKNKATFYFDDLVNVGRLRRNSTETGTGTLFVLPQSHYPLLEKKPRNALGNNKEGGELILSGGHKFLSVQRVTRQSIPQPVKLLNYEGSGDTSYTFYITVVIGLITLALFSFKFMFKRAPSRKSALEVSEEVLGYGSHGTVVFRGKFDGRPVAVKRLLAEFYSLADREISLLQDHDSHPNVIRYFYREQQERFILVALELAQCTLYEFINPEDDSGYKTERVKIENVDKIDLLRQIMSGLAFLHEKGLVHRDLKPQNILLLNQRSSVKVLISDFGLSRKIVESESSFHATAKAAGTLGWRAPEIIFNEESQMFRDELRGGDSTATGPMKIGRSVDIFAAGLIFYFVLSEGQHAFGPRLVRESNISQGRLQIKSNLSVEAENLILRMLRRKGKDRPSAEEVLRHPFFWNSEKRLEFICAVSDVLEAEEQLAKKAQIEDAPPGFNAPAVVELPMRDAIDQISVITGDTKHSAWHKELDRQVFQDLTKHRYYMVNKVHDLLRAIRNKRNHFHESPDQVKEIIGASPSEAWEYFERRYPGMLMECYRVMQQFRPKSLEKYL